MDTILIVDDDRGVLALIETILTGERYRILTASDAESAQRVLDREPERVLAILLDWDLPDISGIELLSRIKSRTDLADVPVIMVTGMDTPEQTRAGIEAGAYYYLTKPFDRSVLLSIINAAVMDHKMQRSLMERLAQAQNPFRFLTVGTFRIRTVVEAERLSVWIANSSADANRAMQISELMINAVEHGNLGITYEEKGRLVDEGTWEREVERRLALPENSGKHVTVTVTRTPAQIAVLIRDEGPGFDYDRFLHFDESRVFDNHGRGIAMASFSLSMRYLGNGNAVLVTIPMGSASDRVGDRGAPS